MKVISKPRQHGKTTELMQYAVDNKLTFICHDQKEKARVIGIYKNAGYDDVPVFTYDEMYHGYHMGMKPEGVVIDNVDMFIQQMVRNTPVFAVAINDEEK